MKKIEQCELREMIRVPFEGFCDEIGGSMSPDLEYFVVRFLKDRQKRFYAPYSSVTVETYAGIPHTLHYGRLVVPRGEPFPSIRELMQIGSDRWSNRSRENLLELYKTTTGGAEPRHRTDPNRRRRVLQINEGAAKLFLLKATTKPSRLRSAIVTLIIEKSPPDGLISEPDLVAWLENNKHRIDTSQPIVKVFDYYKSDLLRAGVFRVLDDPAPKSPEEHANDQD